MKENRRLFIGLVIFELFFVAIGVLGIVYLMRDNDNDNMYYISSKPISEEKHIRSNYTDMVTKTTVPSEASTGDAIVSSEPSATPSIKSTVEPTVSPDVSTKVSKKESTDKKDSDKSIDNAEKPNKESVKRTEKQNIVEIKKVDTYLYAKVDLNVRKKSNADSKIVDYLDTADKVHVTGTIKNSDWCRIKIGKKTAYVNGKYLSKKKVKKPVETSSTSKGSMIKVESTAYAEYSSSHSASGRRLIEGYSIAGKVSWLGRKCYIYLCNSDDSVGRCLGLYSFDDTGYGQSTGYGNSKILKGRSIGTIENGTCIDFYMNSESSCDRWGRRNVYLKFI